MLVVGQILLHLTLRYFPPNTIAFMKISANKLKRQEFIQVPQPKLMNIEIVKNSHHNRPHDKSRKQVFNFQITKNVAHMNDM